VVVDGEKRRVNLIKLTAAPQGYPLSYAVTGITVTGDTASSGVNVTAPEGTMPMPMPMTWQQVGSGWKRSARAIAN